MISNKDALHEIRREGPGEHYLDLLELVIKLNIPDSTEVLLDGVDHGGPIGDFIADRLMEEGENTVTILQSIQEKIESTDIFYQEIRSSYFRTIRKYLEKQPSMSQAKEALVKDIVLNGMLLYDGITQRSVYDETAQKSAIECSEYFPDLIPKVLPELLERATTAPDLEVRHNTVRRLGELGDTSVLPVLAELLNDSEPRIRQAAVQAVSKLQDPSIPSLLFKALNDPDGVVRQRAARHLGQLRATEAVPALEKLAADDPYTKEVDEEQAKRYEVYEERDGKYIVYPVRHAAREALKWIDGTYPLKPTPRPSPIESSVTWVIKTVSPSPEPTATPSPEPTGEPQIRYTRSMTPLPRAPEPDAKTQPPTERQTPSEVEPATSGRELRNIGIATAIAVVIIGIVGYMIYRMKR